MVFPRILQGDASPARRPDRRVLRAHKGGPTPRGDAEAWMRAQVERLVPAFDRRNGNGFYGEHWQTARKLVEALSEGE